MDRVGGVIGRPEDPTGLLAPLYRKHLFPDTRWVRVDEMSGTSCTRTIINYSRSSASSRRRKVCSRRDCRVSLRKETSAFPGKSIQKLFKALYPESWYGTYSGLFLDG
jgi:hypothetical protein